MKKEKLEKLEKLEKAPTDYYSYKMSTKDKIRMKEMLNAEEKPNGTIPQTYTKTSKEVNLYVPEKWER